MNSRSLALSFFLFFIISMVFRPVPLFAQESQKDSVYMLRDVDRKSAMQTILNMSAVIVMQKKYPNVKRKDRKKGTVTYNIILDESGNVLNPVLIESLGKEYDDEALRIINIIQSKKWDPIQKDGKAVKVLLSLPFTFDYDNK